MVDSINRIASALESARVITLEAAAVASSKLGETSYTHYSNGIAPEQLRNLLNSRNPREVKDGMRRLIAILASSDGSIDAESYFADVVKNIISDDIKIKTLVCIYLLRFAEKDPNLALLSINSLQKTLSDGQPEIRALSIKALSDIKIPSLYPIVLHTLKKGISDPSAVVRSEVSFSILKLYIAKVPEMEVDLIALLKDLLSDADPQVISTAILVLKECFPQNLEWLHGHFRYYCKVMHELDTWAQSYLITLMLSYCKRYLPPPTIVDVSSSGKQNSTTLPDRYNEIQFPVYDVINDPDLALFLRSLEKLIHCSNPAVILSGSNTFFQLATPMQFKKSRYPEALVRICVTSSNKGVKNMLLQSILLFSSIDSTLFLPYMKKFFVLPSDDTTISCVKLKILSTLINESNVKVVVRELKYYISVARSSRTVIAAANTLAVCGRLSAGWESHIMKWFISHMEIRKLPTAVLGSYINVIRVLVQNNPKRHLSNIMKLSKVLQSQKSLADNARAGIVWLFGEIASIEYMICPDVLRKLIPTFAYEGPETRCQILLLSAKLLSYDIDHFKSEHAEEIYSFEKSRIALMYKAVLYLAEFDDDYDIRDRARCISSLFGTGKYEIAALLLQAPKPPPRMTLACNSNDEENCLDHYDLSDLGLDKTVQDYHKIIPWNIENVEDSEDIRSPSTLRDYSKYKKSFSSQSYMNKHTSSELSSTPSNSPTIKSSTSTFTSQQNKKYRLQSLDEFFSDIPIGTSTKPKKKFVVKEESTSEEEEETSEENDEEYTDSESEQSTSSSSSSSDVQNLYN